MVARLRAISHHVTKFEAMETLLVARHLAAIPRQMTRASAIVAFAKGVVVVAVVVAAVAATIRSAGSGSVVAAMEKRLTNECRDRLKDGDGVVGEILLRHVHGAGDATVGWLHVAPSLRIGDDLLRYLRVERLQLRTGGMPRHGMRHFLRQDVVGC